MPPGIVCAPAPKDARHGAVENPVGANALEAAGLTFVMLVLSLLLSPLLVAADTLLLVSALDCC
jgi:hypothetical protein